MDCIASLANHCIARGHPRQTWKRSNGHRTLWRLRPSKHTLALNALRQQSGTQHDHATRQNSAVPLHNRDHTSVLPKGTPKPRDSQFALLHQRIPQRKRKRPGDRAFVYGKVCISCLKLTSNGNFLATYRTNQFHQLHPTFSTT
jgi:hypothetical protein